MRVFIAHKFNSVNKSELRRKIEKIISVLEKNGYQTFNYLRDKEYWEPKNFPPGKVIKEALSELKKCDALLVFVDDQEKSEGIFLEMGFAKATNKKTILLISDKCSYPTLKAIVDTVIEFSDWQNLEEKLKTIKI